MKTIDEMRKDAEEAEAVMDRTRQLMEDRAVTVTLSVAEAETLLYAAGAARRILRAGDDMREQQAVIEARSLARAIHENGVYLPSDLYDAADAIAEATTGALGFFGCWADAADEEVEG